MRILLLKKIKARSDKPIGQKLDETVVQKLKAGSNRQVQNMRKLLLTLASFNGVLSTDKEGSQNENCILN